MRSHEDRGYVRYEEKMRIHEYKDQPMKKYPVIILIPVVTALFCFHCAELQQLANIRKPSVDVAGVRIGGLSLEKIGLIFDLNIQNPNPVSVHLAGLDYDFRLNNTSFLKGDQTRDLRILSYGSSRVAIPLTLSFQNMYQTYQALKNRDSTAYDLACGLTFQLPILGTVRIPVETSGYVPLVKIPAVKIHALKLERLSLSGADLVLEVEMNNPNAFKLFLKSMNYDFQVNGLTWAGGNLSNPASVSAKGKSAIRIPVSLNFIEMGRSLYELVSGSGNVNYRLSGNLAFDTSLSLLNNINLPLDNSGLLKITR